MKNIYKIVATSVALSFLTLTSPAQNTFDQVYSIFQANCTVGCHSGSSPSGNLNLSESGDMTAVYNNLVDVDPTNPAAAAKGHKLIDPGYPERSFLLRKCAYTGFDQFLTLDQAEGNYMPDNANDLEPEEVELIRQWIIYGAPETGQVVDAQLVNDYYNGMGMERIEPIPTPEDEGLEGYQVRMGPFFLPPQGEVEYRWKYDLNEPDSLEVYRTRAHFNGESHHFILYKFDGGSGSFPEGYRPATQGEFGSLDISQVTAWADAGDNLLPEGTAYKWKENTVLDVNYHVLNYSTDSILAAEAYVNVYSQPLGTAQLEMFSVLIPINTLDQIIGFGNIGDDLIIPNDGQVHAFEDQFYIPIPIPDWHVWQLSSHTHERGVDYDIYKRNPNGSKGEKIYEGYYDTEYNFNQGFYDWEHPPIRTFDPFLQINMSEGFVQEAKFMNTGPETLYWGLTTEDEMMLMSLQYTEGALENPDTTNNPSSIAENEGFGLNVYPNPFTSNSRIEYELKEQSSVQLELFNVLGEKVPIFTDENQQAGQYSRVISAEEVGLKGGVYLLRLNVNGQVSTHRIVKTQ